MRTNNTVDIIAGVAWYGSDSMDAAKEWWALGTIIVTGIWQLGFWVAALALVIIALLLRMHLFERDRFENELKRRERSRWNGRRSRLRGGDSNGLARKANARGRR